MSKIIFKILGWTFGTYAVVNTVAVVWAYWGHLCEEGFDRMTIDEAEEPTTVLQTCFEVMREDFNNSIKWTRIALDPLKKAFSR